MKVKYDPAQLDALNIAHEQTGDALQLSFPDSSGVFYVTLIGDEMDLQPMRSSAQRQLLAMLGQPQPEPPSS